MCVLLVEDDALIAEVVSEFLMEAGYDVLRAADGREAYRMIADPPVDYAMLVTDLHLADGPNGLDVAGRLRGRFPDMPVIVATGRPDALRNLPTTDHPYRLLHKPYRPSELVSLIADAIGPGPRGIGGGQERSIDR